MKIALPDARAGNVERYVISVAFVAAATLLQLSLPGVFERVMFLPFFFAIAVTAATVGMRPGLLATAISVLVIWFFVLKHQDSFWVANSDDLLAFALFILMAWGICWLSGARHHAQRELEQAQATLQRSEDRYRILAEHSADFVVLREARGHTLYRSPSCTRGLGWSDEEVNTLDWRTRCHPDDVPLMEQVRAAIERGEETTVTYRYLRKDGSYLWLEDRSRPVLDPDGASYGRVVIVARDVTLRKRAEEELRTITDNAPEIIGRVDRRLRHVFINRAITRVTGKSVEQYLGKSNEELGYPAEQCAQWTATFRKVFETGQPGDLEFSFVGPDGLQYFYVRAVPEFAPDGVVESALFVATNVTAGKRTEEQLRRSEALYRAIGESIDYGVWVCSPNGRNTYASASFLRLLGRTQEECFNFGWGDALHPDDAEDDIAAWQECVRTGGSWDREHRFRGADGQWHHILTRGVPVKDEQGQILCWAGINLDIDRLKHADEALRASEQRMRLANEATGVGIWEWDVLTDQLRWDAQMFRIYGIEPTHDGIVHYSDWSGAVLSEDLPRQEEILQDTVRRLGHSHSAFRIRRRSDGECRYIQSVETVRTNVHGQAEWVVGTNLDVTARELADQELLLADRRKDKFLATLAHELRNPLAPIRHWLEIIKRAQGDANLVEQANATIERQIGQMVRLIDDLLDVSRITSDKLTLRHARVELAEIVNQALESSRPLVEARRHELHVTLPPQPVHLLADGVRLAQVLANLLNNAAKYTDPGGRIWLTAERQGTNVLVTVGDNGAGIPASMLSRVFDMFTQVDQTLERSQGGLGIGLTLVKRLVEMHGGTVTARSDGLGQGSEFSVQLPVLCEKPLVPETSATSGDDCRTTAHSVLVVDDNRDAAEALARLLKMSGNETRMAYDGAEAIEMATTFRPEVILLDIGMPRMNGYDACRAIRAQSWGKHMALFALTGWGQEEDRRQAQEAGFNGHLVKPVTYADLLKLLAELPAAVDHPLTN